MIIQDFRHEDLLLKLQIEILENKPQLVVSTKQVERKNENESFIFNAPIKSDVNLSGLQISKIVIDNIEFTPKANRYLLKIVLNYLVKKNKINLLFDLPYKASVKSTRSLINNSKYHPNNKKMSDILPLLDGSDEYFIDTKGSTNSLHNLCYSLLQKHGLNQSILEIHYSKRVKK